jgi:hypothetical protein
MPNGAQIWRWSFDADDGTEPVLALEVSAHASMVRGAPPEWFDVSLAVAADPFRGDVTTAWFEEDLVQLAAALAALAAEDDGLALHVVGGNRAAELRLSAEGSKAPRTTRRLPSRHGSRAMVTTRCPP